jgi:hypothetical protein
MTENVFPPKNPCLVFQEEVGGGSNSGARLQWAVSQVKRTALLDPRWAFDFTP